tara:strand:- start:5314 stop:5658 length:345 start_codon:yes stop_codon:yes gene_type:complete
MSDDLKEEELLEKILASQERQEKLLASLLESSEKGNDRYQKYLEGQDQNSEEYRKSLEADRKRAEQQDIDFKKSQKAYRAGTWINIVVNNVRVLASVFTAGVLCYFLLYGVPLK